LALSARPLVRLPRRRFPLSGRRRHFIAIYSSFLADSRATYRSDARTTNKVVALNWSKEED
jgi:hypothetical protein